MNKQIKSVSIILILSIVILSFIGCKKNSVPELESIPRYSEEELRQLADSVDEKALTKAWGEPQVLDNRRIWTVALSGETKYVVAWVDNGQVTSIHVSMILFVNVAAVRAGIAYCIFGWDDYSTDIGHLAFMPDQDCFGNEIQCEVGDQFVFEFDGMIMETYPAQLNPPYSAKLMGHLSEDVISQMSDDFMKSIVVPQITEEDINRIKEKGSFTWDDFSIYQGEDIGSGLFVFRYDMADGGYVLVSGPSLDQQPQTIIYYRSDGDVDYILSNPNLSGKDGWTKCEITPTCPSRVTFSFYLPDTWECGMCIQSEDDPTSCFCVSIHPKTEDESTGSIIIAYMDGFGVLGSPVIEDTMFNGHKAKMYTCEGASYWNYIELAEQYLGCVIQNTASESWYEKYENEVKEILSTVEFTIADTD